MNCSTLGNRHETDALRKMDHQCGHDTAFRLRSVVQCAVVRILTMAFVTILIPATTLIAETTPTASVPTTTPRTAIMPNRQVEVESPAVSASGTGIAAVPVNPATEILAGTPAVESPITESPITESLTGPSGIFRSLGGLVGLTLLTLVPAILMMTTSFVRISVVLAMLRQAFGMPQIPPPQVLTALAVFLTLAIMMPTWTDVYETAVVPYSESAISGNEALQRGVLPVRDFMIRQIDRCGNAADIRLFLNRMPPEEASEITMYEQVPLSVLLPAFLLSELKTAFWIGFQIVLPFLVIDLLVAAVLSAIGMIMVPPAVVAIPLKLLLFVLADGWRLLAGSLLDGFL